MEKMIFICTGNTCRSPMAERIAAHLIEKKSLKIAVSSRGLFVGFDTKANPKAIHALKQYGIDLENHIPRNFSIEEVTSDTILLTMTNHHKSWLHEQYPEIMTQVYTLKEYCGENGDVYDPYGGSQELYNQCANQIYQLIAKIFCSK